MDDKELADAVELEVNSWSSTYPRLGLSKPQWQQIIAALRREAERPPSGEMVMDKEKKSE